MQSSKRKKSTKLKRQSTSGKRIVSMTSPQSEHRQYSQTQPPDFTINPKYEYTRRYFSTAAINNDLSIADLIGSLLMGVTTTLLLSPFFAIRLKKIAIWSPIPSIGSQVTCSITPSLVETDINSFSDVVQTFVGSSSTIERLANVGLVPKKTHPSGSWHQCTTVTAALMRIKCPIASTIDITYQAIVKASGNTSSFTAAVVGATVGTVYTRPILTNCTPQEVNTI